MKNWMSSLSRQHWAGVINFEACDCNCSCHCRSIPSDATACGDCNCGCKRDDHGDHGNHGNSCNCNHWQESIFIAVLNLVSMFAFIQTTIFGIAQFGGVFSFLSFLNWSRTLLVWSAFWHCSKNRREEHGCLGWSCESPGTFPGASSASRKNLRDLGQEFHRDLKE